ncbi:hydrolases of the alpha/beta superfamily [Candidatus Scalindua japonica]|uniref:Hydrolases of the alpha/beta superfamily n=1 Tax=Candidatus Scalindua japonica TaxID=1284222 RepID=A0A286U0T5_9BACT|nr:alpha/beta hydrolase [Candidatus Scalindua japonica]GAX61744.1 hydrolases of the alpha/beta superfamily [Candidatus Scalindua japonica]
MIIPKFIEHSLVFFPNKSNDSTMPDEFGIVYDDITFRTEDGLDLNGWFIPGKKSTPDDGVPSCQADRHTLLWFHGNAGNINRRLDNLKMLHERVPANVFIIDYRQFGKSEGKISEKGTYLDAKAALAYLHSRKDVNNEKIIFFGRSLGSAVAVDLAVKEKCCALILETPFTSIKEMAKILYPYLSIILHLLSTKYDSLSKIKQITVPTLIMHGDKDELVPFEQGRKLYEQANDPKEFYTIPGAMHNDTHIVGGEKYFDVIRDFVNKLTKQDCED